MNRRTFIQAIGGILAGLGIGAKVVADEPELLCGKWELPLKVEYVSILKEAQKAQRAKDKSIEGDRIHWDVNDYRRRQLELKINPPIILHKDGTVEVLRNHD